MTALSEALWQWSCKVSAANIIRWFLLMGLFFHIQMQLMQLNSSSFARALAPLPTHSDWVGEFQWSIQLIVLFALCWFLGDRISELLTLASSLETPYDMDSDTTFAFIQLLSSDSVQLGYGDWLLSICSSCRTWSQLLLLVLLTLVEMQHYSYKLFVSHEWPCMCVCVS